MVSLTDLVILSLVTYRLSSMLANGWENGPWQLLRKFREAVGVVYTDAGDPVSPPGSFADGLMCRYCNSVWIGLAIAGLYAALAIAGLPASLLFLPLALSGANVLIVELTGK